MPDKQYLAIMINSSPENNLSFSAPDFKSASQHLKKQVTNGTMFQHIKLLELDTLISKTYYL